MLLWRYVRNLGVNVHHPHDVCVGEGGVAFSAGERGPVFTTAYIHVVPHTTSSTSRLARYGVLECEWILWSAVEACSCMS